MELQWRDIGNVAIPSLGDCTLLPLNQLPANYRTYEKLAANARILGLKELEPLSHDQEQEVFKVLALHIADNATIWISGTRQSYSGINVEGKVNNLVTSIKSLEMLWYHGDDNIEMW